MNDLGLALLKSFESCRLTAYRDSVGVWTIGWGQTGPDIVEGLTWTQEQADEALSQALATFCDSVRAVVTVDLNPDQFSAIVDFAYNEGVRHLKSSTLLAKVNAKDLHGACDQFALWHFAGGQSLPGLVTRRRAEACLFASDYAGVNLILSHR